MSLKRWIYILTYALYFCERCHSTSTRAEHVPTIIFNQKYKINVCTVQNLVSIPILDSNLYGRPGQLLYLQYINQFEIAYSTVVIINTIWTRHVHPVQSLIKTLNTVWCHSTNCKYCKITSCIYFKTRRNDVTCYGIKDIMPSIMPK